MSTDHTTGPRPPAPSPPATPAVPRPATAPSIVIDEALLEAWLTGRPLPSR